MTPPADPPSVDARRGRDRGDDAGVDDPIALLEVAAVEVTVTLEVLDVVRRVHDDVPHADEVVDQLPGTAHGIRGP